MVLAFHVSTAAMTSAHPGSRAAKEDPVAADVFLERSAIKRSSSKLMDLMSPSFVESFELPAL